MGGVRTFVGVRAALVRFPAVGPSRPGQTLDIDLRRARIVRRVVLDTGADRGDFPRGWAPYASRDGTGSGDALATGARGGDLTPIDLSPTRPRDVRVVQTATAPPWWSVADIRVYR
jgi:glucosylceramidase